MTQLGLVPDRTTIDNPAGCAAWVIKLDSTEDQLRDAVAQIGDWAADVETHLMEARNTTNFDDTVFVQFESVEIHLALFKRAARTAWPVTLRCRSRTYETFEPRASARREFGAFIE